MFMAFSSADVNKTNMASILLLLGLFISSLNISAGAQSIGVCNGRNGNNLPSEADAVQFFKDNGITRMRIYEPYQSTLQALKGSNIELTIGILNKNLQGLNDPAAATDWVQKNVRDFPDVKFRYIAVGNEVDVEDAETQYLLPAMQNIQSAISAANLQDQIKVSTAIYSGLLENSSPPSNSAFRGGTVVHDPNTNLDYQNLFDALVDSVYAALEKAGGPNVQVVVSESGWPSDGGADATVANAGTYYKNLIDHVKNGTPKRSGAIETYLFAMFDENEKQGEEEERHFGLFTRDKQPKYQLNFN
ncbi:glucan endo-1,3-beta-glucosidase isoform X2 [Ziziphus jujuba]|uniref:glucan endo-1,3-beta-D-glucosidase n=1 Tax=Ziziphus jujuba TaxID=326968 RepID=A0ABM3ZVD6_ZIZJJ|nr:glucan endo-1,3-beta-glucosidase isoform X2 [Ziziphus jujuba]